MYQFRLKWMLALICCLLAGPALGRQKTGLRRLYVEAFATKTGAEKLRGDVAAELRKLSSVSLVPDESSADLILGGGGEVWIRGYRGFSPRSEMKLPTNGTPLYGGYLSVELKNKQGVTVWSYLATPETASEDVSKDLAKRIANHLAIALSEPETLAPEPHQPQRPITLTGAGATFPYPVYLKWFTNYNVETPSVQITYDPVGSDVCF